MFLLFWCFPPSLPSAPPSVRRPSFPSSFVRAKRRRRRRWAEEGRGRRRTRPRSPRRYERARAQTDVTFTHRVTRPRLRERIRDKRSDFYFRLRLCRPRDHGHFNDICTWVVILRVRRASERASALSLCPNAVVGWRAGGRWLLNFQQPSPSSLSLSPPAFAQESFSPPPRFFPLFRPRPSFFFNRAYPLPQLSDLSLPAARVALQEIG